MSVDAARQRDGLKQLHVCQILYSGLGGHGSVVFTLLDAAPPERWKNVLAFIGVENLRDAYASQCRERGIPHGFFQHRPGVPWRAWWGLWRWLMAERPDAVLLHSMTSLVPCMAYKMLRGGRLVCVEHMAVEFKTRREWIFSALSQFAADAIVYLSEEARRAALQRLGWLGRPNKSIVIPNGVDIERFSATLRGAQAGLVRLGMAGRFAPPKRQDLLIAMMSELRRRRPDLPAQLTFAGGGEELARARELAQVAGLERDIHFEGVLDETALVQWFHSLDIYAHASDAENHPTSILQAMATQTPVIASNIPAIAHMLDGPAPCGLLANGQSAADFADAALKLIDAPNLCATLGESGRARVASRYSDVSMFAAYDAALRGAIGSP